jgi:hypothetical protein
MSIVCQSKWYEYDPIAPFLRFRSRPNQYQALRHVSRPTVLGREQNPGYAAPVSHPLVSLGPQGTDVVRDDDPAVGLGEGEQTRVWRSSPAEVTDSREFDRRLAATDGEDDIISQIFVGQKPRPAHGVPPVVGWPAVFRTR